MDVEFLGGAREVGRSALLVNDSLLIDYGMETSTPPQYPLDVEPDAVVVSHGHVDHAGLVPKLLEGDKRPAVHWTPPTREIVDLLARDTLKLAQRRDGPWGRPFTSVEVSKLGEVSQTHGYGEPFEAAGHTVTFFDAGHIPGSAHVLVEEAGRNPDDDGGTRLLYAADYNTADQRLVNPSTARPEADVVVTEATYSDVEREPRRETENRFVEGVKRVLHGGGTVVAPAFAVGRTQELMLVADAHDIPVYVDGMGIEVAHRLRRHLDYLRDGDAYKRACGHARFVTGGNGQRKRIAEEHALVVTTSGMLSGGPALTYIPEIRGNPQNAVFLTGYQVEGTPGRELLEHGRFHTGDRTLPVAAQVDSFDFSAHADHTGLREFLDAYRDATILVNHGDRCEDFADELRSDGFEASAPERGERLEY